jgi:hypothetical protein
LQLMIRHRRLGPSIASTMAFGLPPNLISMPSTVQMRSIFASAMTEAHLATSPATRILNSAALVVFATMPAAWRRSITAALLASVPYLPSPSNRDPDLIQLFPPERVRSVDLLLVTHCDLARTARVRATWLLEWLQCPSWVLGV